MYVSNNSSTYYYHWIIASSSPTVNTLVRQNQFNEISMFVYKVHKIRIISLLIICLCLLSLFSVFVLHSDIVGDQYSGQGVQWSFGRFWLPFFVKPGYRVAHNTSEDYGDYGPYDIIADDEVIYEGESESELLSEDNFYKIDYFDHNLAERINANVNKVNKHNVLERKLHGQKKEDANTAYAFTVPTARFEKMFTSDSGSCNYSKIFWSQYLEDIMPKGENLIQNLMY